MRPNNKISFLLVSVILGIVVFAIPNPTYAADVCAPFYQFGGYFPPQRYNANQMSDIKQEDRGFWEYNFNASEPVDNIETTSEANFNAYTFSQIFLGMYNIVAPFNTAELNSSADAETIDRWKTLCIDRNNKQAGSSLSIQTSGVKISQRVCDAAPLCGVNPATNQPIPECNCRTEESDASEPSKNFSFELPYVGGIREIARKIPSIISTDLQYCKTDGTVGCNFGYACTDAPQEVLDRDPEKSAGMNGICTLPPDPNAQPFPANILCLQPQDEKFEVSEKLASKACRDTNLRQDPPTGDSASDPYFSAGKVEAPTNSILFDAQAMELYYKNAFITKLGLYNEEDAKWISSLPARIYTGVPEADARESDDFVDRLGGYAMLAEDVRFLNPDLIPAGDAVMVDDTGNEAYLRAGDGYHLEGALFINEKPFGHKLTKTQRSPYIASNGRFSSSVVTSDNKTYVSLGTQQQFGPLIELGEGDDAYIPQTAVNSLGDTIVFSRVNGRYMAAISEKGKFTAGQGFELLPDNMPVTNPMRMTIDAYDRIHMLWGIKDEPNKPAESNLYYTQFSFTKAPGDAKSSLKIVRPTVNLREAVNNLINTTDRKLIYNTGDLPFTLQVDPYNNVLISVRVGPDKNYNKLLFTVLRTDNTWLEPEIAVSTTYPDTTVINDDTQNDGAEYFMFSAGGGNKIATIPNPLGDIRRNNVAVIYKQLYRSAGDKFNSAVNYTFRLNGSDWRSRSEWYADRRAGYALSDIIDGDWNEGVVGEGFTKRGTAYFTVDERTAKFNKQTKLFDPAARKRCVIRLGPVPTQSTQCGQRNGLYYVLPPTQTTDGKMQLVDPITKQVVAF